MYFLLITILVIISSFIAGFLVQSFMQKVVPNSKREKTISSKLLPWMLRVHWCKHKIIFYSLFNDKNKKYLIELRKEPPGIGQMDNSLYELLITEKSKRKIDTIIETVFHYQEKNRRKTADYNFFAKRIFSSRQIFITLGTGNVIRATAYLKMFVHYNRYLLGHKISIFEIEQSINYFGSIEERNAVTKEIQILSERSKKFRDFLNSKGKELGLKYAKEVK